MKTVPITHCVCPILGSTETGDPDFLGSATLLGFGTKRFLVTSAHVLDFAKKTTLYVPTPQELIPLTGQGKITNPPSGSSRFHDKNDSAFLVLGEEMIRALEQMFFFLPPQYLDPNDSFSATTEYTFVGFPEKGAQLATERQHIDMQRYTYSSTSIAESGYEPLGLQSFSHVAAYYDRFRVEDERGNSTQAVPPNGISGGPVFRNYLRRMGEPVPDVKLVGIGMETREDERAIVGVRLNGVYEAIRRLHPDIFSHIPENPQIEIVVNSA